MNSDYNSKYITGIRTAVTVGLAVAMSEWFWGENSSAQTTTYKVVELSAPDADQIPSRLNNLGDVVGRTGNFGTGGAAMWSHGTFKSKRLGFFAGGDYSSASAINDVGQIAGGSNTATSLVPFIWQATLGLQRVALLPDDNGGQAFGINKSGHVVGYSSGPAGERAFFWTPNGGVRNLGMLPGGTYSRARAVNNSDQVVGTSGSAAGDRAVLWTNSGQIQDLGTLPGDVSSEATAMNNGGCVVGYSNGAQGLRAFLWTPTTGMQDLGVLPGGVSSRALDINDAGIIVGSSTTSSGDDRAFIWTQQTGMTDLNSAASAGLGVVFWEAHAINNPGQILVMGKAASDANSSGASVLSETHDCAPAPPSTFLLIPVR
jgi:probable HAF family extracellular repeat protein